MSAAMQLRVKAMTLAKSGRRWTEFLIEHETTRGWRVLASFKTTEEVHAFLAERQDDEVEIVTRAAALVEFNDLRRCNLRSCLNRTFVMPPRLAPPVVEARWSSA